MALSLARPARAPGFATMATVLGGVLGYYIGMGLFQQIGRPILEWYRATDTFGRVEELYRE